MHGLRGDNGNLEYGVGALLSPDRRSGKAAGEVALCRLPSCVDPVRRPFFLTRDENKG